MKRLVEFENKYPGIKQSISFLLWTTINLSIFLILSTFLWIKDNNILVPLFQHFPYGSWLKNIVSYINFIYIFYLFITTTKSCLNILYAPEKTFEKNACEYFRISRREHTSWLMNHLLCITIFFTRKYSGQFCNWTKII